MITLSEDLPALADFLPSRPTGVPVDALKRLQVGTAAELNSLLPAILDRTFKGEL